MTLSFAEIRQASRLSISDMKHILQLPKPVSDDYLYLISQNYSKPSKFLENSIRHISSKGIVFNHRIFTSLLTIVLFAANAKPIHKRASLHGLPNIKFDFVLYDRNSGPIIISSAMNLKTKFKQLDLEGMVAKQLYPKSKLVLITPNESLSEKFNKKISDGKNFGVDEIINTSHISFDKFINRLSKLYLVPSPSCQLVKTDTVIT